jgi:hypothetical protein
VDRNGIIEQVGTLRGLSGGRYLVQGETAPPWLLGESGQGLFESLPYFLYDLRPTGYLGLLVARQLAAEWGFPPDPRQWQDKHLGRYFLERGDDLPGNLVVGEAAARRINAETIAPVGDRDSEYPDLARRVSAEDLVGSSAAGEQPKFAVCQREAGHVIVKFSPRAETPEARRWRDLLLAELHASRLMREQGLQTPDTALYELQGRTFLESPRFDRHGRTGRSPAISLGMVDAEYAGAGHGWTRIADRLQDRGLLDRATLERIAWAETFGAWIGNTDMHPGNLSLAPAGVGFELLPIYDMLPMALAPVRGELPRPHLRPPIRSAVNAAVWEPAGLAGVAYWQRLADDRRLTDDFRELSRMQARTWRGVLSWQ